MNDERLIPPTLLYRFSVPCHQVKANWNTKTGIDLSEKFMLPGFSTLDGQQSYADVRAGWSTQGMFLTVKVETKQQGLWCRETQLMESDGFQVWIDTRNTNNVHRATRFCHWFLFLPTGGGSKRNAAVGTMLRINRSRDDPKTLNQTKPKVVANELNGGYHLMIHIPGRGLDGWDTEQHTRIGFNYAVVDRELGDQSLAVGTEFPTNENPSLWQTLDLVD